MAVFLRFSEAIGRQMQGPFIPMPETGAELKRHNFVTKNLVPKFRGLKIDNWDCWKRNWVTAITNSVHQSKLAIMEALQGEAAVQAQQIIKGWQGFTADEIFVRLDGIFMSWQESHLARLKFRQYRQHPNGLPSHT